MLVETLSTLALLVLLRFMRSYCQNLIPEGEDDGDNQNKVRMKNYGWAWEEVERVGEGNRVHRAEYKRYKVLRKCAVTKIDDRKGLRV